MIRFTFVKKFDLSFFRVLSEANNKRDNWFTLNISWIYKYKLLCRSLCLASDSHNQTWGDCGRFTETWSDVVRVYSGTLRAINGYERMHIYKVCRWYYRPRVCAAEPWSFVSILDLMLHFWTVYMTCDSLAFSFFFFFLCHWLKDCYIKHTSCTVQRKGFLPDHLHCIWAPLIA